MRSTSSAWSTDRKIGQRDNLNSYPSWDEKFYAPADGKIVTVVNDLDDNLLARPTNKTRRAITSLWKSGMVVLL